MNLPSWAGLPTPPSSIDAETRGYLIVLHAQLTQRLQETYQDISQGQSVLTRFSAAPTAQQVDERQLVLRVDAGNEAIYTKIDGVIFSAPLT